MRVLSESTFKDCLATPERSECPQDYEKLGCWVTPAFLQSGDEDALERTLDLNPEILWTPTYTGDWEIGGLVPIVSQVRPLADYIGARVIDAYPRVCTLKLPDKFVELTPQAFFELRRVPHNDMYYLLKLAAKFKQDVEVLVDVPSQDDINFHVWNKPTGVEVLRNDSPFDLPPDVFYEFLSVPLEQLVELYFIYALMEVRDYNAPVTLYDMHIYNKVLLDSTLPWQVPELIELVGEELLAKKLTRAICLVNELTVIPPILNYMLNVGIENELLGPVPKSTSICNLERTVGDLFDFLKPGPGTILTSTYEFRRGSLRNGCGGIVAPSAFRVWTLGGASVICLEDLLNKQVLWKPGQHSAGTWLPDINLSKNTTWELNDNPEHLQTYVRIKIGKVQQLVNYMPKTVKAKVHDALTKIYSDPHRSNGDLMVIDLLKNGEG